MPNKKIRLFLLLVVIAAFPIKNLKANENLPGVMPLRNIDPLCNRFHPDESMSSNNLFADIENLHGPIRSIIVSSSDGRTKQIDYDKKGRLILLKSKSERFIYEYDDKDRILLIKHYDVKTGKNDEELYQTHKYTYIDKKNLVLEATYYQPENEWVRTEAAIHEKTPDNTEICYMMDSVRNTRPSGTRYALTSDRQVFSKQSRYNLNTMFPITATEKESDEAMFSVLNDLRSIKGNECGDQAYSNPNHWDCSFIKKSNEGNLTKYIGTAIDYDNIEFGLYIDWFDQNGLPVETASLDPVGKKPPTRSISKFNYDNYHNWIEKKEFIKGAPSLTNENPDWELKTTITRIITYY